MGKPDWIKNEERKRQALIHNLSAFGPAELKDIRSEAHEALKEMVSDGLVEVVTVYRLKETHKNEGNDDD